MVGWLWEKDRNIITGVSVAEREVLAPAGEGDGVIEDVGPRGSRRGVDESSHGVAVWTREGVVRTGHLWRRITFDP